MRLTSAVERADSGHMCPLPLRRLIVACFVGGVLLVGCVGGDDRAIAEAGDAQVERHTDNPLAMELEIDGLVPGPIAPVRLAGERTSGDGLLDVDGGPIRDTQFQFTYELAEAATADEVMSAATAHLVELGAMLESESPTERVFVASSRGDDLTITLTDRTAVVGYDIGHVVTIRLGESE